MTTTSQLTKTPTTWGNVKSGDIIDGETIERVQSFGKRTRLGFPGPRNCRWTDWQPSDRHVSVYR